jgi:hypothetical protein
VLGDRWENGDVTFVFSEAVHFNLTAEEIDKSILSLKFFAEDPNLDKNFIDWRCTNISTSQMKLNLQFENPSLIQTTDFFKLTFIF